MAPAAVFKNPLGTTGTAPSRGVKYTYRASEGAHNVFLSLLHQETPSLLPLPPTRDRPSGSYTLPGTTHSSLPERKPGSLGGGGLTGGGSGLFSRPESSRWKRGERDLCQREKARPGWMELAGGLRNISHPCTGGPGLLAPSEGALAKSSLRDGAL